MYFTVFILNCMKMLLHVDGAMVDAWCKAYALCGTRVYCCSPYPPPLHASSDTRSTKSARTSTAPSDAAAANNGESRDAIEMATLPNIAALQQETESPTSPVATTGPSTTTGATTTTATGVTTRPAVDPFDLSEDQIKSRRGLFSFSRVTGTFSRGRKT